MSKRASVRRLRRASRSMADALVLAPPKSTPACSAWSRRCWSSGRLRHLSGIWRRYGGLFGGAFLTPRNLWILLVQTSSIAVMATGMVLVIVMRHIDLSVGSMLSLVGWSTGVLQVYSCPADLGVGHPVDLDHRGRRRPRRSARSSARSTASSIAYPAIPAFIVTLGGLIACRGVRLLARQRRHRRADGQDLQAHRRRHRWLDRRRSGAGSLALHRLRRHRPRARHGRRQRRRFNFPLRPVWAEVRLPALGSAAVLGATAIVNCLSAGRPAIADNSIRRPSATACICMAAESGLSHRAIGIAMPVLIALAVGVVDDLHRHAHALRPLCLRHRRQSGSGRTRRHQHQAADGHGLHR